MRRIAVQVLFATMLFGSVSGAALPAAAGALSYENFVARAQALRPGETRGEIVAALGKPTREGKAFLSYSLIGLKGMPPPVGTQFYYAAEIEMKNGRMVGAIKWAWMDTTGPAPATTH